MFNLKQRMNDHEITMIDIHEDTTQILTNLQERAHFDRYNIIQRDRSREFNVFVDLQSSRNDLIDINKKKRFKIVDVDYFDSYLFDNYNKSDVITLGKNFYKNVYFFIDAIKNITKLMRYYATRIRLHRCFRDIAQEWYKVELNEFKRQKLKNEVNLIAWINHTFQNERIKNHDVIIRKCLNHRWRTQQTIC